MIRTRTRLAAVLAGTAAAITVPAASSAAHAATVTLHYTGQITAYSANPVRASGIPAHPGDQAYFVTTLYDNGQQVGNAPHTCTAVDADYTLCTAVVDLAAGQLTLQTALSPNNSGTGITVAITGGTGTYRGASGEVHITTGSDGTQSWTVDLTTAQ